MGIHHCGFVELLDKYAGDYAAGLGITPKMEWRRKRTPPPAEKLTGVTLVYKFTRYLRRVRSFGPGDIVLDLLEEMRVILNSDHPDDRLTYKYLLGFAYLIIERLIYKHRPDHLTITLSDFHIGNISHLLLTCSDVVDPATFTVKFESIDDTHTADKYSLMTYARDRADVTALINDVVSVIVFYHALVLRPYGRLDCLIERAGARMARYNDFEHLKISENVSRRIKFYHNLAEICQKIVYDNSIIFRGTLTTLDSNAVKDELVRATVSYYFDPTPPAIDNQTCQEYYNNCRKNLENVRKTPTPELKFLCGAPGTGKSTYQRSARVENFYQHIPDDNANHYLFAGCTSREYQVIINGAPMTFVETLPARGLTMYDFINARERVVSAAFSVDLTSSGTHGTVIDACKRTFNTFLHTTISNSLFGVSDDFNEIFLRQCYARGVSLLWESVGTHTQERLTTAVDIGFSVSLDVLHLDARKIYFQQIDRSRKENRMIFFRVEMSLINTIYIKLMDVLTKTSFPLVMNLYDYTDSRVDSKRLLTVHRGGSGQMQVVFHDYPYGYDDHAQFTKYEPEFVRFFQFLYGKAERKGSWELGWLAGAAYIFAVILQLVLVTVAIASAVLFGKPDIPSLFLV
jgi:hypothetical protein